MPREYYFVNGDFVYGFLSSILVFNSHFTGETLTKFFESLIVLYTLHIDCFKELFLCFQRPIYKGNCQSFPRKVNREVRHGIFFTRFYL